MSRLKIIVMAKFSENFQTGQSFIQFLWGTDWFHNQNMFVRLVV